MNQMTKQPDMHEQPLEAAQVEPKQKNPALEEEKATLNAADAQLLYKALVLNSAPVARRGDLVELNNRIVKLFTTLNTGLGEQQKAKAAEDRAALVARLDEMETSVNRMEGALRIEFEPLMRKAMEDVVQQHVKTRKSSGVLRGLVWIFTLATALGLGAYFGDELLRLGELITSSVGTVIGTLK